MESKKFSFVIPIYNSEKYLSRCIHSLLDQDWKNKEIICVQDGYSKEADKIIKKFQVSHPTADIKNLTIEHGGACWARNEGFRHSTGNYVSFFNSDYCAAPGMIRAWSEAFEDNDCDFVYSGYGYIDPQAEPSDINPRLIQEYPSEKFNSDKLDYFNYIDCGSPIKREIFQEWDINCKSLQDWDFFLRIVRAGHKGFHIEGNLYSAEVPRKGGLSNDSSNNWLERVEYVRNKHGLKTSQIAVTSFGAQNHAIRIAKQLGIDFRSPSIFHKPHKYKMIYLIGCYTGQQKNWSNLTAFANCSKDCIKVIHWVGADIFWLRNMTFAEVKYIMPKINREIDYHLVECEQMQAEMKDYGVDTEIVPIAPPGRYDLLPLPDEFRVAVMKTEVSDFDKYCGNLMDEIMAALPQIKFKVFGDGKCKRKLDNVENLGYVDMEDLIPKTSCFLRIVRHDGMMMAANEFVMCGRNAITNLKMPYMEFIDTSVDPNNWDKFGGGFSELSYPETKAKIMERIIDVKNGVCGNKNPLEASEYYKKLLDPDKYNQSILALLERGKKSEAGS